MGDGQISVHGIYAAAMAESALRAIGASIVPKGGGLALDDCQIMPVDFSAGRHLIEDGGTEQIFGENEQTARIPVKPVDAAVDKREILLRKIVHDSVSQCIVVIVDRRMDGHIGRLVNHHQICIFIDNTKRKPDRNDLFRAGFFCDVQL